jgi:hypothetical protein
MAYGRDPRLARIKGIPYRPSDHRIGADGFIGEALFPGPPKRERAQR